MKTRTTSLRAKFTLLVGVTCGLFAVAIGTSFWQLRAGEARLLDFIEHESAVERTLITTYAQGLQMGQALRNILIDPKNPQAYTNFAKAGEEFDSSLAELQAGAVYLDGGTGAAREMLDIRAKWKPIQARILELVRAGNVDGGLQVLIDEETPAWRAIKAVLTAQMQYMEASSTSVHAEAVAGLDRAYRAAFILAGLAVLAAALVAAGIARGLLRELGGEPSYAAAVTREIGAGRFDGEVKLRAGDDSSTLAAIKQARDSIQGLIVDINRMSKDHDLGEIDTKIPAEKYQGDFGKMAVGVNEMVFGHIAVKKKAMACVAEFGRGNFEAKLEAFPGKKAFINETIEKVRGNLKALIADADLLAKAAVAGELDARTDAGHHEGDFRRIVEGVNATLDAVVGPINEVKRVMVALSGGDLTQKIDGTYAGDFQVLQAAVNDSIAKLNGLLRGIKGAADAINSATKEISAGNNNLSRRTEEEASSLGETASSMEELTSTVKQNADHAHQADQLAHGASDVASKGGEKVREVVVTMNAITDGSHKISEIIAVIDGIAFQTNILALNAAVEAARAGEQGRGFGVVASEVRTLAQRSAAAAKEIKALINHSVETVENGSRLVEQAGSTMDEIVAAVKRVTDIIAEISAASNEQSRNIEHVSTAVAQLDVVTQQNAALVEESAATAAALKDEAQSLARSVSAFRLDTSSESGRPGAPASVGFLPTPRGTRPASHQR